jgi:hypothetical protein
MVSDATTENSGTLDPAQFAVDAIEFFVGRSLELIQLSLKGSQGKRRGRVVI